jgi:DNA-directed RNA polymerase specialized sigma24 family protein
VSVDEDSFADVLNGFSLDSGRRRPTPAPRLAPPPEPVAPQPEPAEEENASIVRAYAWTAGRTRSDFHLEIETLVSASVKALDADLSADHQEIVDLCRNSKSVAEVAALLGLPLGIVKILLGDMARLGLIIVYENDTSPDMELLERVLRGLTKLRT